MTMFAERLQSTRKDRKITQVRLAAMLEVNPRVYNRWERGTSVPQLDTIVKIADILGVSLDVLVGREKNTQAPVIHNLKLHAMLNEIDALPDDDQKALVILMDSLIKRSKIDRLLSV